MTDYRNPRLIAAIAAVALAPWLISAGVEAASGDDNYTRVNIVGIGTAPQPVRLLTMQAGVTNFATTASRAVADNARAMASIRAQLARHGIDPKDVRTGDLNLRPTSHDEQGREIRGFQVVHNVSIVFRDVDKTGAVMDTLVGAGANQINGPRFSYETTPEVQGPARLAAIRDAEQRAQFYAKTLGMKVRRVVSMQDSNGYASPQPAMRINTDSGTEISPGTSQVQVMVNAQYELMR